MPKKITGEDAKSSPVISKGGFVLGASVSGLLNQLGDAHGSSWRNCR
jgi:hypothetical protein